MSATAAPTVPGYIGVDFHAVLEAGGVVVGDRVDIYLDCMGDGPRLPAARPIPTSNAKVWRPER